MKLKNTLLTIAALSGSAAFAFADDTAGSDKNFGDGGLPEFLEKYDLDGDSKLDEEERQAAREDRRQRIRDKRESWDSDGDGTLSEEERNAARAELRAKIEARRCARFEEADRNDDGELSLREFASIGALARLVEHHPERVRRIFNHLDADNSDSISKREFLAHLRHRRHYQHDGNDHRSDGDHGGDGEEEGDESDNT